jgi:hypothetical protein
MTPITPDDQMDEPAFPADAQALDAWLDSLPDEDQIAEEQIDAIVAMIRKAKEEGRL